MDWKFFPTGSLSLIAEWRRRVVLVCAPDARALAASGMVASREWHRCYDAAMTPARAAEVLASTGADYVVRRRPPAGEPAEDAGAPVAFANGTYVVARPVPAGD